MPGVVVLMDLGSAVLSRRARARPARRRRARTGWCSARRRSSRGWSSPRSPPPAARAGGGRGRGGGALARQAVATSGRRRAAGGGRRGRPTRRAHGAVFTVANPHGLHARPAARLVRRCGVRRRVQLRNLTHRCGWVAARQPVEVATLGVLSGDQVEVRASGRQAREALDHVLALAARSFDERRRRRPSPPEPAARSRPAAAAAHPGSGSGRPARRGSGAVERVPDDPGRRARRREWRRLAQGAGGGAPRHQPAADAHRPRGRRGRGRDLRRAPDAARRRRPARRRARAIETGQSGGPPGRPPSASSSRRVRGPARPVPAGPGRRRPRGRGPGARGHARRGGSTAATATGCSSPTT